MSAALVVSSSHIHTPQFLLLSVMVSCQPIFRLLEKGSLKPKSSFKPLYLELCPFFISNNSVPAQVRLRSDSQCFISPNSMKDYDRPYVP